jgi:hypothetical protein
VVEGHLFPERKSAFVYERARRRERAKKVGQMVICNKNNSNNCCRYAGGKQNNVINTDVIAYQ